MLKEKLGKSAISAGQTVELIFKDANNDEIKKVEQVSNEYGSFNGSFTIPVGKLNGMMRIVTDFGSVAVRVEEYKRPTFEVKFLTSNEEYLYSDTVRVKGNAVTYAGYPVGNAEVKYTITKGNRPIITGRSTTNSEGIFWLAFFPLNKEPLTNGYDEYLVKVEVVDQAGETRYASKELVVNDRGLDFTLFDNNQEVFLRKEKEISLHVHTKSQNAVKAKVRVQWFHLTPPTGLKRNGLNPSSDYSLLMENWKATKMPLEENLNTTDGNVRFTLKEGDLSPGYYRILITAISENLDTGINDQIYRIYDSKPDSIKLRSEWAIVERETVNVGDDAVFRVAGFRDSSNVFYEVTAKRKVVKAGWLKVSALQTIFKLPINETLGDHVNVAFMMVQDGEWHKWNRKVYITNTLKELDVKFLSFRDKLQPGEKEIWKLRISNKAGEKQQSEILATLFDASLEAFGSQDYYSWLYKATSRDDYYQWTSNLGRYGGQSSVYFLNRDFRSNVFLRDYEKLNVYSYNYYGNLNNSFSNFLKGSDVEQLKRMLSRANERLKQLENSKKFYGLIKDPSGYGVPAVIITLNNRRVKGSDPYGVYVLDAKPGDQITFTSFGFVTHSIFVKQSYGRFDINLREVRMELNEVVIRGYQSRPREATTGSSTVISSRVGDGPVANLDQLLEGKVAGLRIKKRSDEATDTPTKPTTGALGRIIPRTNFSETAFFFPQLRTNSSGEVDIEFTIPQSLTRYKMLGFAHTKAFETLFFSKELITQKQFAIAANAPRFFREGDTIVFSAKLYNMAGKALKGKAYLELRNALTGNVINVFSAKSAANQGFVLGENGNAVLNWPLVIPVGIDAVTYKVVAESGKYSDGEESTIPVLSNSILVTEAIPLNLRGNTSKTFTMEKLLLSAKSNTLRNQSLTLEFTANPVWNAIQAMPYLMEYPYECAEQTMSRFYANSFATGILNSSPKIKAVFEEWQKAGGNAFSSNLDKNSELKALLLEETPWVRNAGGEEDKKKRLATLFNLNRMSSELKANFEKLAALQNANGSFSWFKGMSEDRYITQQIMLNMAQLRYLKMIDEKQFPTLNILLNKALIYLDGQFKDDFNSTTRFKGLYSTPLHYLYARSYNKQINEDVLFTKSLNQALEQINQDWLKMSTYEQGLAALVLHRNGRHEQAVKIVKSLKDRSQQNEEFGMYWPDNRVGWWWYQSPVETQALMIEVFDEVAKDITSVEEMKIWLLKNKQNNDWKTTKATTAACYALLMRGYDLLDESAEPEISIGGKTIVQLGLSAPTKEAGTGYRKIEIKASDVKPEMGTIFIKNNNKGMAWGALYWQYFEQADKVTSAGTGIILKKELFLQSSTATGPVLTRLSDTNTLKKGDLIKVRIEIRCDRPMEYLHLKDMRAAGFEPTNVLSTYKYQDGLGYYESTKDASTNFFISYMPKGVYVFEYPLRVNSSGNLSNGITTLQSMYAPEFTTHSEGIRVSVK
jgi:hypothetical protein